MLQPNSQLDLFQKQLPPLKLVNQFQNRLTRFQVSYTPHLARNLLSKLNCSGSLNYI